VVELHICGYNGSQVPPPSWTSTEALAGKYQGDSGKTRNYNTGVGAFSDVSGHTQKDRLPHWQALGLYQDRGTRYQVQENRPP